MSKQVDPATSEPMTDEEWTAYVAAQREMGNELESEQPFGGEALTYDEVLQRLVDLRTAEMDLNWRIGDLCKWLPEPGKVAKDSGFPGWRLERCAEIAAAFPEEDRERDLTWSFFAAVKHLPHDEAVKLLDQAEDEDLGLVKFGRLVRGEPEGELHECPECGRTHRGHAHAAATAPIPDPE